MTTGRGSDQFMLRLPDGMRDEIKAAAEQAGHSMNAEFVARLEQSMTLRDWFAGQAMQARLTGSNLPRLDIRAAIATDAYAIADAMLEARAK